MRGAVGLHIRQSESNQQKARATFWFPGFFFSVYAVKLSVSLYRPACPMRGREDLPLAPAQLVLPCLQSSLVWRRMQLRAFQPAWLCNGSLNGSSACEGALSARRNGRQFGLCLRLTLRPQRQTSNRNRPLPNAIHGLLSSYPAGSENQDKPRSANYCLQQSSTGLLALTCTLSKSTSVRGSPMLAPMITGTATGLAGVAEIMMFSGLSR